VNDEGGTWHYGLVARWWAEFNVAEPAELAYYRGAIERYGQPALDLACGTGRLLGPLLLAGFDVDGADISPDMLRLAGEAATKRGFSPHLYRQAMHELHLERTYRTIFICDSFGLGGRRDLDQETLRRVHRHLEPGGALVFSVEFPYAGKDAAGWAGWLPSDRVRLTEQWPDRGNRRRTEDGDELELSTRTADLDPIGQVHTLEMRARLWRAGQLVAEEFHELRESLYFAQEVLSMLESAGFEDVTMEGRYTGSPATASDDTVVFVARSWPTGDATRQASARSAEARPV
jgi:SAM-dependent methyltransferase